VTWVAAPVAARGAAAEPAAAAATSPLAPPSPPPRLLTGGLDKAVLLWAQASQAGLLEPRACWRASKKISAVAVVPAAAAASPAGAAAAGHVFLADRYGKVLSAPLPAAGGGTSASAPAPPTATTTATTAAEGAAAAAVSAAAAGLPSHQQQQQQQQGAQAAPVPILPCSFALGHLSSGVSRALAVPADDDEGGEAPGRRRPPLLATSDADGKVRLSRVPACADALARHGLPEVHAYAMGHRSAVVDLALLLLPRRWLPARREDAGGDASAATAPAPAPAAAATTAVLVSGGADGTVRLWCPDTGAELCRATVSAEDDQKAEAEEEEEEEPEGEGGGDDDDEGGDEDGEGGNDDGDEAAAARQALERMQRLEAALAPGDDARLRDARCPSVAAVAACDGDGDGGQEGRAGGRPPLVAVAVEGEHEVYVFAVGRPEPEEGGGEGRQPQAPPLRLRLLRRSPVDGVRFPTSLQFSPAPPPPPGAGPAAAAASPPLRHLLWAAGGLPSAALITGAPVLPASASGAAAADAAGAADVSADVGAADALTGADAAPALAMGVLAQDDGAAAAAEPTTAAGEGNEGATPAATSAAAAASAAGALPPPLPAYSVPLLWRRREAERRRHGRPHGAHLKRGRADFAETARMARLHQ